jgi:VWFA-related protein
MNSVRTRPGRSRAARPLQLLLCIFFAICAVGLGVRAQQQPKIEVHVKSVDVTAIVRDKHGKIIPDLTADAFVLEEDGRPQTINYFAKESDLPLRLGLLVDTSLSQRRLLEQERKASYSFVDHLLREHKDLASVFNFDHEVQLLQDFTDSRPKLQAAFESLEVPDSGSRGGASGGGRGSGGGYHGGTLLYDAVYLASDEVMSKQQGRKALIILSDGDDRGSKETLAQAIEAAQRADTVIYSILFKDEESIDHGGGGYRGRGGPGGGSRRRPQQEERVDGKKILAELSRKSGGQMFEVSRKETVDKIYAEIDEELRHQYRFGYTPDQGAEAGYHKISLTTHNKDLLVQARDGYYGGS